MFRRSAFALGIVLLQVGAFVACSDPPARPGVTVGGPPGGGSGGGGGEGGADSGRESGGDGGVCNDVVITGLLVDRIGVVGDPPVASGGTIASGNYDLTGYSVYVGSGGVGGPTGITAKATIRIAAGKLDEAIELGGTGKTTTTKTSSSAYTATGATLAETELCPTTGGGKQLQFTAADPILTLTDLTNKEAFTYTKR